MHQSAFVVDSRPILWKSQETCVLDSETDSSCNKSFFFHLARIWIEQIYVDMTLESFRISENTLGGVTSFSSSRPLCLSLSTAWIDSLPNNLNHYQQSGRSERVWKMKFKHNTVKNKSKKRAGYSLKTGYLKIKCSRFVSSYDVKTFTFESHNHTNEIHLWCLT